MTQLDKRQRLIVRLALAYAQANLDDFNEVYSEEEEPPLPEWKGMLMIEGKRVEPVQADELIAILEALKEPS